MPRAIKKPRGKPGTGSDFGALEGLSALGALQVLLELDVAGGAVEVEAGALHVRRVPACRAAAVGVQPLGAGRVVVMQDQFGFRHFDLLLRKELRGSIYKVSAAIGQEVLRDALIGKIYAR